MAAVSSRAAGKGLVVAEQIEARILAIRGEKVILDGELAALYQVPVRQLNQAVKRNRRRFPPDFLFQLTTKEAAVMRSQTVISSASAKVEDLRSQKLAELERKYDHRFQVVFQAIR